MRYFINIILVFITSSFVASASTNRMKEVRFNLSGLAPEQEDDWDSATGISGQIIFWQECGIGLGLSIGSELWQSNEDIFLSSDNNFDYAARLEGEATMIPLGASGLYRVPVNDIATLVIEGGIKYVIIDSDIEFVQVGSNGLMTDIDRYEIDIDNGVIGVLGIEFEFTINENFSLFVGGGYQFDIDKGSVDAGRVNTNYKNSLEATFGKIGAVIDL